MELNLKINYNSDIEKQFKDLAIELFFNYELVVNNAIFDLAEIEFYFHSEKAKHPDPYVHCNELQLTNSQWYFHGSGIDITFGDEADENYGGILIRGLKQIAPNEKYISGPIVVAKEIFHQFNSISVKEIPLGIRKKESTRVFNEYGFAASTRINLPKREGENDYRNRYYRFITHICPKHGFNEKGIVAQSMKNKGLDIEKINEVFEYRILK